MTEREYIEAASDREASELADDINRSWLRSERQRLGRGPTDSVDSWPGGTERMAPVSIATGIVKPIRHSDTGAGALIDVTEARRFDGRRAPSGRTVNLGGAKRRAFLSQRSRDTLDARDARGADE